MTAHLSPQEFVEAVDEMLAPARRDHLAQCAQCRLELDALRAVMEDVRPAGNVPGPSPLFWDHFVGRVQAAAELERTSPQRRWRFGWQWAAVGGVVGITALAVLIRPVTPNIPEVNQTMVITTPAPIAVPGTPEALAEMARAGSISAQPTDEASPGAVRSWNRVVSVGRGASADDVHALAPAGPAAAVLIEDLSQRELEEFARLLRAQMGGVQ